MILKKANLLKLTLCLSFASVLTSCATFSDSYPKKMEPVTKDIKEGKLTKANSIYISEFGTLKENITDKNDDQLYYLETGRLLQLDGDIKGSQESYMFVINELEKEKSAPKVTATGILENSSSIMLSDRETNYVVPSFERTFLYMYQSLNFLGKNNLNDAAVTIRKLSDVQYFIQQQNNIKNTYQKATKDKINSTTDKIDGKSANKNSALSNLTKNITSTFMSNENVKKTNNIVAKSVASFENGSAFFLSTLIYEAYGNQNNDNGSLQNAGLSIKNAVGLSPNNPYILDLKEQIYREKQGYNIFGNKGRLVIMYENGFVETKQASKIDFPVSAIEILLFGQAILSKYIFTLPFYNAPNPNLNPKTSILINDSKYNMEIITNTNMLAAKSLFEEYPTLLAKSILRFIFKASATYISTKSAGVYGALTSMVYTHLSSVPDQRSWLLLPHTVEVYQKLYNTGEYNVKVGNHKEIKVKIVQGKTTLIWATKSNKFETVKTYIL